MALRPVLVLAIVSLLAGSAVSDGVGYSSRRILNDPHLIGGDGVHFDFIGDVGKSYCLIADRDVHLNMRMGGYLDTRTTGGALVTSDGKAVRTWITEFGVVWKDEEGEQHSMVLKARTGEEAERGVGFLSSISMNGVEQPILSEVGSTLKMKGLRFTLQSQGMEGPLDMDSFTLNIGSVFAGTVNLRAAHLLLRTETEAFVHFNLQVDQIQTTPLVHGVLGQTLRTDAERVARGRKYMEISELLKYNMHADGPSGAGYLDGATDDYVTSRVDAPDCKFALFSQAGAI